MLRIKKLKWKTRRNRRAMLKKAAVITPVVFSIALVLIGLISLAGSLLKADTPTKKPVVKKTVKPVVKKPSLVITEPPAGFVTDQSSVIIRGRTEQDGELTLNGTTVPINSDGSFNFFFSLVYGMNTCRITVANKSGQVTEQEISIECTRPPMPADNTSG